MIQHLAISSGTNQHSIDIYIHTFDTADPQVALILVPGLYEGSNTPLFIRAADKLSREKGVTTIRLDSESFYKDNTLGKTSLHEQNKDLRQVANHFRKRFKKIVFVAHSLGAFSVLISKDISRDDRIILWDPSQHPALIFANYKEEISAAFRAELEQLPSITAMLNTTRTPLNFIFAEKGAARIAELYAEKMSETNCTFISGADHNFSNEQHLQILVDKTCEFIAAEK